ncbi:MAG TPA: NADH-quinone oxidoreductase subunit J [Myxococcota bacterium]|nr:NADH-quinone oxidoreductase subunit J [Myxococcota bacterium]
MSAPVVLFYVFAVLAVVSALGMVLNVRNTVAAALSLVVTMVALSAIYVLLEAHLVAAIQVIVYAGAIVVLFLFVVMLLNLRTDAFAPARARLQKLAGALIGVALLAQIVHSSLSLPTPPPVPPGFGGYRQLGVALYTDYVLLVEVASLLLTAAIVGALILAKRKID